MAMGKKEKGYGLKSNEARATGGGTKEGTTAEKSFEAVETGRVPKTGGGA